MDAASVRSSHPVTHIIEEGRTVARTMGLNINKTVTVKGNGSYEGALDVARELVVVVGGANSTILKRVRTKTLLNGTISRTFVFE